MKGMLEWAETIRSMFSNERPNSNRPAIEKAEGDLDKIQAELEALAKTAEPSSADELLEEE